MRHPDWIRCPACRAALYPSTESLHCSKCGEVFPDADGVWDLRTEDCRAAVGGHGWDLAVFEEAYEQLGDYSSGTDKAIASGIPAEVEAYRYPRIKGRLLDWVGERGDARTVLDIGCGVGYFLLDIEARLGGEGRTFVGVDVAAVRARHAAARFAGREELEAVVASAEELPFPDGFFDLIVCTEVMEHIDRPERALREIGRVLAPGGVFLLSSPNRFATEVWEGLFSVPRFIRRLATGRLNEPVSNPYDQPIGAQRLRKGLADAGLEVDVFDRNVFLPHESYFQFLPDGVNRAIVRGGGYLESHAGALSPWLGLHYVVRASKPAATGGAARRGEPATAAL